MIWNALAGRYLFGYIRPLVVDVKNIALAEEP
jgi:hypothetical protein